MHTETSFLTSLDSNIGTSSEVCSWLDDDVWCGYVMKLFISDTGVHEFVSTRTDSAALLVLLAICFQRGLVRPLVMASAKWSSNMSILDLCMVAMHFLLIWSINCIAFMSRSWNFSIGLGDNKIGYWIPSTWYMHNPNGSNEARHRVPLIVTRQWPRPMTELGSMQVCTIHQVSNDVLYTDLCSVFCDWYIDPGNCWVVGRSYLAKLMFTGRLNRLSSVASQQRQFCCPLDMRHRYMNILGLCLANYGYFLLAFSKRQFCPICSLNGWSIFINYLAHSWNREQRIFHISGQTV